jgi:hypothetical protein
MDPGSIWFKPRLLRTSRLFSMNNKAPLSPAAQTVDERTWYHEGRLDAVIRHRHHLLAIAAELEKP